MPELIEVELYRRLADRVVGRRIAAVDVPDPWFLKRGTGAAALGAALVGRSVAATRRRGKLLLLDVAAGPAGGDIAANDAAGDGGVGGVTVGLRFGMTGRLVVDGHAAIERLEYASGRDDPAFVRWGLRFTGGGQLVISDPRRLGGVELDADEDRLGPDAARLTPAELRAALAGSRAPLKARLLDQSRVAGLGNLLVDETLWRAGLDPARQAASLVPTEVRRLHRHLLATVGELLARGGSHTGDLHVARTRGGACPRDGTPLDRRTIGGRTTYSCPRHQR